MEAMAAEWRQTPTRARFSDNESDLRLLARIAHGDRDAFRELYATYYQPVLRFIHRVIGESALVSETAVRAASSPSPPPSRRGQKKSALPARARPDE